MGEIFKLQVLYDWQSKTLTDTIYYHRSIRKSANIHSGEAGTREIEAFLVEKNVFN